jgi:glutamate dehydrogenase (NAD(P)+)
VNTPIAASPSARVEQLQTVDGMIVYDVPGASVSGGGTRLAPDIADAEMRLLARAMTYKLAVVGLQVGGAKIGLRSAPAMRASVIDRFRVEIADRLGSGVLMTGPDLGTTEADFAGLPTPGGSSGLAARAVNGVPVEEMLTGYGVVAALAAALGDDLRGASVALEGFGKMGASIARELDARGGRVVAVSTLAGCAVASPGTSFPIATLLEARDRWGDGLVHRLGVPVQRAATLWSVDCDALIPGARPGVLDELTALRVRARVVMQVANAPYTQAGLQTLHDQGIEAYADFVASAGGAMAYLAPSVSGAPDVDEARHAIDEIMGRIVTETRAFAEGPYAGAVDRAERFLATWLPESELPSGPPLA